MKLSYIVLPIKKEHVCRPALSFTVYCACIKGSIHFQATVVPPFDSGPPCDCTTGLIQHSFNIVSTKFLD